MDILIEGTGAMACLFAARFAQAKMPVTLSGTWQEALSALKENGVRLVERDGSERAYPVSVVERACHSRHFEQALVLVKSWQTEATAERLKDCLSPSGLALTLQNGLGNQEQLEKARGSGRVCLGVTTAGATLLGNAQVIALATVLQLAAPGSPLCYSSEPMAMDVQSGLFEGLFPAADMVRAAHVQMAKRYGIPIFIGGWGTCSKAPDVQAGYEKAFSAFIAYLSGADMTSGPGLLENWTVLTFEQLLIDLSWQSSRLEGNRKSWLDTKLLFERGHADENDVDALMLLNHKEAIEFIVEAVPEYGISEPVVRNLQSVLMQGLLTNPEALGQTRRSVVNITDSVYLPLQIPQLLDELLAQIIEKTRNIKNPIEASFFLWLNIAYLQPFEDGNKRTSRLCANLPLLLQNCAPLAFLDVEQADYALAVLGVYEQQNPALAVELFEWTYRRSVAKYAAILESLGSPDQFRQRYRERLGDGVRQVVAERIALNDAVAALGTPPEDNAAFKAALHQELKSLSVFNCARYRLGLSLTERWIADGRPGF